MRRAILDADNEIRAIIDVPDNMVELNTPSGCTARPFPHQGYDYYWNLTVGWTKKHPAPGVNYKWDAHIKDWVIDATVVAQTVVSETKATIAQTLASPIRIGTYTYQADDRSLQSMVMSYTAMAPVKGSTIRWKLLDNTIVTLTAVQLLAIIQAITARNTKAITGG